MASAPVRRRPNFVLFVTDQHRADHLGCYGHPVLRTPAIDGLARRGIRFDACHVASPRLHAEPREPHDRTHAPRCMACA